MRLCPAPAIPGPTEEARNNRDVLPAILIPGPTREATKNRNVMLYHAVMTPSSTREASNNNAQPTKRVTRGNKGRLPVAKHLSGVKAACSVS